MAFEWVDMAYAIVQVVLVRVGLQTKGDVYMLLDVLAVVEAEAKSLVQFPTLHIVPSLAKGPARGHGADVTLYSAYVGLDQVA